MGYHPHSLIYLEDIGLDSAALYCYTDNGNCCRGSDNPFRRSRGSWRFSDGALVVARLAAPDNNFSRTRNVRALLLHGGPSATGPTGIYICQVPDRSGITQNVYFGIYNNMGCEYCSH